MSKHYLNTGQRLAYDALGRKIEVRGSGQDSEHGPGAIWPNPRFTDLGPQVLDRLTGLVWLKNANPAEFPLTWSESLEFVAQLNRDRHLGQNDWRMPNRREMRSLISYQTRRPALPLDHPFENVFSGWYWTSTTAAINTAFAWYVHTEGGRMFYGQKTQSYLLWPVRDTGTGLLPATGQNLCFNARGERIGCAGTGQDGFWRAGAPWPRPRFKILGQAVWDQLTELTWTRSANLTGKPTSWDGALAAINLLKTERAAGIDSWRLPTINELETLVDAKTHTPALPDGHPFVDVQNTYCSSTSSAFEPDWAMVLHLNKGAVGVGRKNLFNFFVWGVA